MKKYKIIVIHAISDRKPQKIKREFESVEQAFAILETEGYKVISIKEV